MLFSDSNAVKLGKASPVNYEWYLNPHLKYLADKYSIEAILICLFDEEKESFRALAAHNLALTPFDKTKNENLKEALNECFGSFSKPHVHAFRAEFVEMVEKLSHSNNLSRSVMFIPLLARDLRFIFLGFMRSGKEASFKIEDEICEDLLEIINSVSLAIKGEELEFKLHTLELYTKEVGHDIASAVQAIISKLRNISRGYFVGESAIRKIKEVEEEIMSEYRIAENMGIVVDPDYNIDEGMDFNIIDAARAVIQQYRSEANERHIEIRLSIEDGNDNILVWGDRRAIESAIGQYLLNAVKYARGGSYIKIKALLQIEWVKIRLKVSNPRLF